MKKSPLGFGDCGATVNPFVSAGVCRPSSNEAIVALLKSSLKEGVPHLAGSTL